MKKEYQLLKAGKKKEKALSEFGYILQTYIIPLLQCEGDLEPIFPCLGSESKRNKHIEMKDEFGVEYIYFFPALLTAQFVFRIKSASKKQELKAAEVIIRELLCVCRYDYSTEYFVARAMHDNEFRYQKALFDVAFEVGLCNWLGSNRIYDLLGELREWSQKTYEGEHVPFGFMVDSKQKIVDSPDYLKFLTKSHSAVFTDGVISGIKLDGNGKMMGYFTVKNTNLDGLEKMPWAPYEFVDFTNMCYSDKKSNWIGIIMRENGDMLIFKGQKLVFAKHNGKWSYLNSHKIHSLIHRRYIEAVTNPNYDEAKRFASEVYSSVLDSSFERKGACIAIIDEKNAEIVKNTYFPEDALDREVAENAKNRDAKIEKKEIIKRLISNASGEQKFQDLDRKLRLELLSLDGATVLDTSGRILCVGAIVKINGGSAEGGRSAAAMELAKNGFAMKISEDGSITCFEQVKDSQVIKQVLKIM